MVKETLTGALKPFQTAGFSHFQYYETGMY